MNIVFLFVVLVVVLLVIAHFWTYSSSTDAMGCVPGREYMAYLKEKQKGHMHQELRNIPPPPDGVRDEEVEALLKSGRLEEAGKLLGRRMDEARMAPVGGEKKMARINHYLSILRGRRM